MTPSLLPDQALLRKVEGLQMFRREEQVLLLQPSVPSALMLDKPSVRLLGDLARPRLLQDLVHQGQVMGLAADRVRTLMARLVDHGMLSVNGRVRPVPEVSPRSPSPILTLPLRLDGGCSPACARCAAVHRRSEAPRMPPRVALDIVDRALAKQAGPVTVVCTGSEPLHALPELLAIVEGCAQRSQACPGRLQVVVHTRGERLDPRTLDLLRRHEVAVALVLESPLTWMNVGTSPRLDAPPSGEALWRLLERGSSVLPAVVVREPGHFVEAFEALVGRGFRTFRLVAAPRLQHEPVPTGQEEAWARGFIAMVRAAASYVRGRACTLAVSDLDRMVRRAVAGYAAAVDDPRTESFSPGGESSAAELCPTSGADGAPDEGADTWKQVAARGAGSKRSHPMAREMAARCGRCPVQGWCGQAPLQEVTSGIDGPARVEFVCRYYQKVLEELLWILQEEPALLGSLGGNAPW